MKKKNKNKFLVVTLVSLASLLTLGTISKVALDFNLIDFNKNDTNKNSNPNLVLSSKKTAVPTDKEKMFIIPFGDILQDICYEREYDSEYTEKITNFIKTEGIHLDEAYYYPIFGYHVNHNYGAISANCDYYFTFMTLDGMDGYHFMVISDNGTSTPTGNMLFQLTDNKIVFTDGQSLINSYIFTESNILSSNLIKSYDYLGIDNTFSYLNKLYDYGFYCYEINVSE